MEFQKEYSVYDEENEVSVGYGIEVGSNTILFIKAGHGGDCHGYEDKYVRIAKRIHEKYGCSVFCASNPVGDINMFPRDMENIKKYAHERGFDDYEIYFMGVSNGANQGLWRGCCYPEIKRMLFVNMPLMINFHKTGKGLNDLAHVDKIFVYGSRDESFKYVPFLEIKKAPKTQIKIFDGVDHQFRGEDELFRSLPELLFF